MSAEKVTSTEDTVSDAGLIPMDEPLREFKSFLDLEDNKRIFFSGKFGSGKTFFLEKFFEKHTEDYDVYYLFPIRYQVLENRDIIQLIKYDILISVFEKSPKLKSAKTKGFKQWVENIARCIDLRELVSAIPQIGRTLDLTKDVYNALVKAAVDFDSQQLNEFQENMEKQLANSFDIVLQRQVQKLSGKNKRSVLVLDDLDRMDPEHIFRMLNILSAKMETGDENEMGFDHIILVGDLENIRHIFSHKYGKEADFQGYFDKFSSFKPHAFDNASAIVSWIQSQAFGLIQYHDQLETSMGNAGYLRIPLEELLKQLIRARAINLRQLYRPMHYLLPSLSRAVKIDPFGDTSRAQGSLLHFNRTLEVLISLFEGGKSDFIHALETIRSRMPESFEQLSKEAGCNRTCYSLLWEIMQESEESPKSLDGVTPKIFYKTFIQYVEDKL